MRDVWVLRVNKQLRWSQPGSPFILFWEPNCHFVWHFHAWLVAPALEASSKGEEPHNCSFVPVQSSMTAPHCPCAVIHDCAPCGSSPLLEASKGEEPHTCSIVPLAPCSHPWLRPCLTKWQFGSQKSIKGLPGWDHISCLLTGKKTTPHCLLPSLPKMSRFVTGRNSLRRKVRHFQLKFCYFLKSTITAKFPQSPPFSPLNPLTFNLPPQKSLIVN